MFYPNFSEEALKVYGTDDLSHSGVRLLYQRHPCYVGGPVTVIDSQRAAIARQVDFLPPYRTPQELWPRWKAIGKPIVAFQTRNPMHGAHYAVTKQALKDTQGHLLIHPTVGPTNPGDMQAAMRIRAVLALAECYPASDTVPPITVSTLPLAMRMAGPREAIWHALIRQNFGADYFIVGRAPADPGHNPRRSDGYWWDPYAAHDLFRTLSSKMQIQALTFPEYAWHKKTQTYMPIAENNVTDFAHVSGTWVRNHLSLGNSLPEWYAPKPVRHVLEQGYRQLQSKGLVFLFTGLPASGKSTLAMALVNALRIVDNRPITLLDGDIIRRHLSKGLGFTREDRQEQLSRAGFVAQIIAQHGGIAVMALIAPYQIDRQILREQIEEHGKFVEIYLSTPLEICEQRDPKGLYTQARSGQLQHMTGIDEPYQVPATADLIFDTQRHSLPDMVEAIIHYLQEIEALATSAQDVPRVRKILT
ncbi:MAG: adenylyl-sulfate kinase [Sulfobacillus benefaciens]|uniref:adenylyl-sulfate kinase n=1 Tax=Sulfobacillus benefaciens TaxID=453960 RepID=A0A2T2XCX3_9FIRM|nr:MAG: adenylyl-sulfate kinase [Sulfobacillus benefaciens]